MADTTTNAPGTSGPSPGAGTRPVDAAVARRGRVRFSLARWVLDPRTTWQARRLAATSGTDMDADTAWMTARLARHPDERAYVEHHRDDGDSGTPTRTPTR